ncbi:lytic transglycosylase domain-containing protein [Marinoscillum sp. MHG1-6]|uniref:lytic transglycosylase domain-containing protein n=1 Tax=Marinoscillum sp. MHG1-6 TaxID=2959627 RepID=UPI002157C61B|nr:lytic transglycosylase domain-containing protein [Marinoscillum sp. MHG1-6]
MRLSINIFLLSTILSLNLWAQEAPSYDYVPDVTYEEIEDRIGCIASEVPLNFNERVRSFVDYFTVRDREYTRAVMSWTQLYFPIFEEALEKHGVPEELKYLSIVESGLRTNAISRANAVGLWQFMSATGKIYGLSNDWYMDERMDPYKASDAAARHLGDLYRIFDDWELALAAYNCGAGNVRKAIRRSGYKKHFWDIYPYLPRETRSYVPQFVAVTYAFQYAEDHNLFVENYHTLPPFDTVMVSQYLHLETFASTSKINFEDLLNLNPEIKRGALPEGTKDFALKIPEHSKEYVVANRSFLYDTAGKVGKAHLEYLARNTPGSTYGRQRMTYRVKSGDVLGTIAQQYGVRISDLRAWNNLSGNMIRVGQHLNVWVLPNYTAETKKLYASTKTGTTVGPVLKDGQSVYYVQPGDTLWTIAKNHPGLSIEKLKELNKLTSNTIKPGQPLIISSQ